MANSAFGIQHGKPITGQLIFEHSVEGYKGEDHPPPRKLAITPVILLSLKNTC
jgi:hypothetical protein